jgi:hypothetical protein
VAGAECRGDHVPDPDHGPGRWPAAASRAAAPVTLINPERIYTGLIKPSLVALWLSQLIVFAVYLPRPDKRTEKSR